MSQTELALTLDKERTILFVPNSGVQFVDLAVKLPSGNPKIELAYTAVGAPPAGGTATPQSHDGSRAPPEAARLISLVDRKPDGCIAINGQPFGDDHVFAIDQETLLSCCEGRWFPLPFLRNINLQDRLDEGPTNWVRGFLQKLDATGPEGETHRLVIAVDTSIDDGHGPYTSPTKANISHNAEAFRFAVGDPSLATYLAGQPWLVHWARNTCALPVRLRQPEIVSNSDNPDEAARFAAAYPFALYCAYLRWIGLALEHLPEFRFINTEYNESRVTEIPVDLVLDVGNSRTCGILFEHVDSQTDLANCYTMKLRDLSQPIYLHKGPFSSRMEFVDFSFGDEFSAKMNPHSSQRGAFTWWSMARVGPEAQRLAGQVFGNEGDMGLSSPKRYIWDTEPTINTWYLNPHGRPKLAGKPRRDMPEQAAKGDFAMSFTDAGERVTDTNFPVVTPRYSRSAMMTYFLAELFLQAFNQINAPYVRYNRRHFNRHRRIRRIVLTVPTAMTLEERLIFERRARDAQEMLWNVLGFNDVSIELLNQWDEAVATQAVYLYNETRLNFVGNVEAFFAQDGRVRALPNALLERLDDKRTNQQPLESAPSLRIASIDIGGGTTDLIVTTYYLIDRRIIVPHQNFREGFNVAGDDILGSIIQKLILPKLANALFDAGIAKELEILGEFVGADREGATVANDHNMRRQFCSLVLIPTAIRLISAYEDNFGDPRGAGVTLSLGEALSRNPDGRAQLEAHIRRKNDLAGRQMPVSIFDAQFACTLAEIDAVVRSVIGTVMSDLAEATYAHQCDTLLLSGRPSRMPAVRDLLLMHLPIGPHRLIAMHDYVVDDTYPFHNDEQKLDDPKTTVTVGAKICAMSRRLEGFFMLSDRLQMRSTVRFIGEVHGFSMQADRVIFENVDLDDDGLGGGNLEARIDFTGPMKLGFRQMREPRWQATPYYELDYRHGEASRNGRAPPPAPYEVELKLRRPSASAPISLVIASAKASKGQSVKEFIELRLNTLPSFGPNQERHWLDAGIFDLRDIKDIARSMRGG